MCVAHVSCASYRPSVPRSADLTPGLEALPEVQLDTAHFSRSAKLSPVRSVWRRHEARHYRSTA